MQGSPTHAHQLIAICVVLFSALTAITAGSNDQSSSILACLNSQDCQDARTTWDHLLLDKQSCFTAHRIWWSPRLPQLPVTLVTQLSINRLQQLQAQCRVWGGPLAAAVYVSILNPQREQTSVTNQEVVDAQAAIEEFYQSTEKDQRCQLRIVLVSEAFKQPRSAAVLYPVNSLRNYARLMADTPLIANIDVDMLPSVSISKSLRESSDSYIVGCSQQKHVYVLPAFDTSCGGPAYADSAVLQDKEGLHPLIAEQCLAQFRKKQAPACHNVTDYERWFKATEPYQVTYVKEFEPWYISDRHSAQWFDFRFRGYGKNKIMQVAATASSGAVFMVHPSGFLVHRQHTESQSRKVFLRVKFKSRKDAKMLEGSLFEHIESLWNASQPQLAAGTYKPELEHAVQACLAALPWWSKAS